MLTDIIHRADFELKAFHELLTTGVAVTMSRLRLPVQRWIDKQTEGEPADA